MVKNFLIIESNNELNGTEILKYDSKKNILAIIKNDNIINNNSDIYNIYKTDESLILIENKDKNYCNDPKICELIGKKVL